MNYSRQFISDQTGFDQGHKFESIEQIREYFTETNISEMFPGEKIISQEKLDKMADTVIENFWHCKTEMKVQSLAKEIVSQMNDDDKLNFEKESWREGIGNIIAGSDESYWDVDDDLILDEIEEILLGKTCKVCGGPAKLVMTTREGNFGNTYLYCVETACDKKCDECSPDWAEENILFSSEDKEKAEDFFNKYKN